MQSNTLSFGPSELADYAKLISELNKNGIPYKLYNPDSFEYQIEIFNGY